MAAQPARKTFAIGFQTGHEMNWLPRAMHLLRAELKNIQVTISSDYSPDLAQALVRGRLDVAFLRAEPTFDLCYEVVDHEPLIVMMPSDHRLTNREAIHPREFMGEIFIGGSNKATVLRAVTDDYLRRHRSCRHRTSLRSRPVFWLRMENLPDGRPRASNLKGSMWAKLSVSTFIAANLRPRRAELRKDQAS